MNSDSIKRWLTPITIILSALIFLLDLRSPVGTADFIFYFIPIILTILQQGSKLPLWLASLCTIFSILGFHISPPGTSYEVAQINRIYAGITLWAMAFLARRIIITKNEMDDRNWLRSGLNILTTRMRGEKDTHELAQETLSFLADYVQCRVGAIFVRRGNEEFLDFAGGYARSESKMNFDQGIRFGEGVLGQVAINKETVVLNLPADYIKISSSLGESIPRYLQVIPLLADDEIVGVMELAFLSEPKKITDEFLNELKTAIGTSIRSSLYKAKLAELLAQAQQYAEELQSQQEELRVTNEELEQQSRALKETATKLEGQQAELEQSNQQLEEQTQILEGQKNMLDEKNRDLRDAQKVLLDKTRELEISGKYKSEFLANMSHELRTPLNSSLILARLLADNKKGNLSEEQVKYAEIIHSSGNDLLNLINDILDLSRVEAGKLIVQPEVVSIEQVVSSLKKVFTAQAQAKNISFHSKIFENVPTQIFTDRLRLEQILKNFISNAFKFTEKGEVRIEVRPEGESVAFDIIDTGIGIPENKIDVIFEAFQQADGNINRRFGGTGLGLSISKELTKLLKGQIQVASTVGKGSTFTLLVPLELKMDEASSNTETQSMQRPSTPTPKVIEKKEEIFPQSNFSFEDDRKKQDQYTRMMLIVEDDPTFARILYDLAHEMNFGAIVASTAEEGISLSVSCKPQAIVLDIRLPDHNGLVVLDQLKMKPETRHIPVHVISSQDFSRSVLEMGAVGFMLKPVKREQLKNAFNQLSSALSHKPKHVLLVEDDEIQRDHIIRLISDEVTGVDAVKNATEALEKLSSKTYDCMIMDLSLPDVPGNELLQKLSSENSVYSFPPVIVYTARDLPLDEEEQLRMHAGCIIIKGAKSPERLLSEVTLFLHKVETELPPQRQKMLKDLRDREKTLNNRKILLVDDDVRNIFALTSVLESFGAQVEIARNGIEALEKTKSTKDIDIILMDIMMPEMDGFEATRRIRQIKEYNDIPIIALTAKAMKDDQEKCLEAGANDYMAKPIQTDKLLSLIRVWLPGKRRFLD